MLSAMAAERGGEQLLASGAYLTLGLSNYGQFDYGQFDVNGGCNYMNGTYAVDNGRLSVIEPEVVALGACSNQSEDWWFATFLSSSPYARVDGPTVFLESSGTLVTMEDLSLPAGWQLDPAFELTPDARTVHLSVLEGSCASGQSPEGRILDPVIDYGAEEIRIAINIRVVGPDANCIGNAEYAYAVQLREPVGNRRLVGGTSPSGPAATPTPQP
jgi:hypothetical protein